MKRKIPRDAADRIAVAGPERDVRNLVPFLRMEKCFFLTSPFIEHEAKNSEGRSRSYCSRWAGAGCQKFGSFPADGEVFFLDIPFYRTSTEKCLGTHKIVLQDLRRCLMARSGLL